MPAFTLIVLDKSHHGQAIKCAKCGKLLMPGQKAWKHKRKYGSHTIAKNATKPYGVEAHA